MAIVKMKRLRLIALRSQQKELLAALQRLGCVEVSEPRRDEDDPVWASLSPPDDSALTTARAQQARAGEALAILKRLAPKEKGFAPRPTVSTEEFTAAHTHAEAEQAAEALCAAQRELNLLAAEAGKLQSRRESLAPWLALDVPLDTPSTASVTALFGSLPATADMGALEGELGELCAMTKGGVDKDLQYLFLLCHNSVASESLQTLQSYGFSRVSFRDMTGTAAENDRRLARELEENRTKAEAVTASMTAYSHLLPALRQWADRTEQAVRQGEAAQRLRDTGETFYLSGWFPAEEEERLTALLADFICAWDSKVPSKEEYPDVPVKLKNNWFTRPLNMVTDMYSLPAYDGVDPNPLMAPFFIFFYGFMMADMGYGILMMLASFIIMKKLKPNGPTLRHMIPLLGLCGISTFIMGALTGGFFGDLLPQLAMMLNPDTTFTAMPALFSPLDDALAVLVGSLAIGVCQIFTGMAVSMYRQIKAGETMAALCNEGAWFLVFALFAVGALTGYLKAALIAILILLAVTQTYGKKGIIGKIMGFGGSLYNNITGYFSDILSYSRLMALMLAGAVIAQVFNTLGGITGNVITFFIISMIGNTLNFALNLLSCYVHDMRLQCLEYFGRFYSDGGKPFRPLAYETKHVDLIQE